MKTQARSPNSLRRFLRARRSAVGVTYVLWSWPLLLFMAVAVNFGYAVITKAQLDSAADSAALLTTTLATNALQAGGSNITNTASTAGIARFNAKASGLSGVTVKTLNVNVVQTGASFNSTVQYSSTMKTILGSLVGLPTITISGQVGANAATNPYVTVNILMDVSSSMAIPSTPAGITQMENLTANYKVVSGDPDNAAQSCAFACHWRKCGTNDVYQSSCANADYWWIAYANNVQTRLTVMQSAVTNTIIPQIQTADTLNQYQLGMWTFAKNISEIYPPSTNIAGASAYVGNFMPDINLCANDSTCPETYFTTTMASLSAALPAAGDGSALAKAKQYVIIITDGVVDDVVNGTRYVQAVNSADCSATKAKATVMVLYTPYYPITNNAYYNTNVAPLVNNPPTPSQVVSGLTNCASAPSYYFTATNTAGITTALQQMLQIVQAQSSHLTN